VQVDRRAEHDVDPLGEGLLGQQPPGLGQGLLVPGGRQQRGVREEGDDPAAGELQAAHAGGPVGEADLAQADRRLRRQGERRGAGEQRDLGGQVEGLEQRGVGHGSLFVS
jgi:hypothetical protein